MKLKLDLHEIYNDSAKIEASLHDVIEDALRKRATEVEIIPGKGSGALKKTVLRFLDRPEIKARYHRVEKDGDNWGRLFVHFRFEREQAAKSAVHPRETVTAPCFCCGAAISVAVDDAFPAASFVQDCPSCGSPNRLEPARGKDGRWRMSAEPGYE